jgi:hypothetical protein
MIKNIEGFKVFSATKHHDRSMLGERVTEWLRTSNVDLEEIWVKQSSDAEFHCLSIVIAYKPKQGVSNG